MHAKDFKQTHEIPLLSYCPLQIGTCHTLNYLAYSSHKHSFENGAKVHGSSGECDDEKNGQNKILK